MATIKDERSDKGSVGYVVFTDSFLSGWGEAASGRSLYILAVDGGPLTSNKCINVLRNGAARGDMKRGRYVRKLPRFQATDHVVIADETIAPRWYIEGAFVKGGK